MAYKIIFLHVRMHVILFAYSPYIKLKNGYLYGEYMEDWNILLRKMKLLEFTAALIISLIFTGMILILNAHFKLAPAILIYLMSIFIDYIFTIGILLLQGHRCHGRGYTALQCVITLFIMFLSGYKFCSLLKYKIFVFPLYAVLWFLYIRYKRQLFRTL